jgi:phage gp46-like protein
MDIALLISEKGDFDIDVQDDDLVGDEGPVTPLTISLFTDRAASPDDRLPDERPGVVGDRRGWWGDLARDGGRTYPIGSKLWLLFREKELPDVVARAQEYARACLDWIRREKGNYSIAAQDMGKGRLKLEGSAHIEGDTEYSKRWIALFNLSEPYKIEIRGV